MAQQNSSIDVKTEISWVKIKKSEEKKKVEKIWEDIFA